MAKNKRMHNRKLPRSGERYPIGSVWFTKNCGIFKKDDVVRVIDRIKTKAGTIVVVIDVLNKSDTFFAHLGLRKRIK